MEWGSWHCTGDRNQDHPHGKEKTTSGKCYSRYFPVYIPEYVPKVVNACAHQKTCKEQAQTSFIINQKEKQHAFLTPVIFIQ